MAAVVALVAAAVLAVVITIKVRRDQRKQQLVSYYDVRIGASKKEVGYRLGYPASVQGPYRPDPSHKNWQLSDELKVTSNGDLEGQPSEPPGGSALKQFDEWHYDFRPDRVTVDFDPETKMATSVLCEEWQKDRKSKCKPILGITVGSTEEDVVSKLGPPAKQDITEVFKSMSYPEEGIELMLTKGRVYLVRKVAPRASK